MSSTSRGKHEALEELLRLLVPPMLRQRGHVQQSAHDVGVHFVSLGEVLEALMRDDVKVDNQARALTKFVNEKVALVSAFQLFKKTTDLVDANLERTMEIGNQLLAVTQHLDKSQAHQAEFSELVLVFWALVTSIRIEAAMLSEAERDEVVQLATSMERVHSELKQLVQIHFVRLAAIRQLIADICRQIDRVRGANQMRVKHSVAETHTILASFQSTLDGVATYCESTALQSAQIRDSFNQIVVALQFQDIIRQKLEQVAASCARILTPPDETQLEMHLAFTHHVALVQEGQLSEARQQLFETESCVAENATRLLAASELALDATTELRAGIAAALGNSDAAGTFLTHLTELRCAISSTSEIAQVVTRAVKEVRAQLLEQVVAMAKFTQELRRIALNAQLHALRVSTGKALEELSAQTRCYSDDMRAITDTLLSELRNVLSLLEQVSATLVDFLALSNREDATLCGETEDVRDDLVEMSSEASASFSVNLNEFTGLRQRIRESIANVRFPETTTGALERAQRFFALLGHKTESVAADVGTNPTVLDWLKAVRLEYVMQDQRGIHDGVTSTDTDRVDPNADPFVLPQKASSATESSGLGDNVELF